MVFKKIVGSIGKFGGFRITPGAQVIYNTMIMLMMVPFIVLGMVFGPPGVILVAPFILLFVMFGVFAIIGVVRLVNKYLKKISFDDILKASSLIGLIWILYAVISGGLLMSMGTPALLPIIFVGILIIMLVRYSNVDFQNPQ